MNLAQLWYTGLTSPSRAFDALKAKRAPRWGFTVVVAFNVAISCTTLLALHILGHGPQMESWLTFLPDDRYLLAEMFFLPPLRVGLWLMEGAVIHTGLRLADRRSDFDLILNIGGLAYLVVMPPLMLSDWALIALGRFGISVTAYTHGLAGLASFVLSVFGLRRLLDVDLWLGMGLTILSTALSIGVLAIFAR